MATTSEEVKIKLGVDSKTLLTGLDQANNYVKGWKKKQANIEEEYTNWWKNELKNRSDAELREEIKSASRRNRARELWRNRAKNREMKIAAEQAAEEARINAQALEQRSAITMTTLKSIGSKAISLLRANVYMAGMDLLRQMIPTAEEFWDGIYGTDQASMERAQQAYDNLKKLQEAAKASRQALWDVYDARSFRDADNLGKEAILEANVQDQQGVLAKAKAHYELMKATGQSDEKRAAALKDVYDQEKALLELEDKLSGVRSGFSESEMHKSLKRRSNITKEVSDLRTDVRTYNDLGQPEEAKKAEAKIAKLIATRNNMEGLPEGVSANQYLLSMNPAWQKYGAAGMNKPITAEEYRTIMEDTQLNVIISGVQGE